MKIGLFIPCYVDAVYPEVAVATYKLLKHYDVDLEYPLKQTCCGQPQANGGFQYMSEPLIEKYEDMFKKFDYVVAPSASCAAFVRCFHPEIMKGKMECTTAKKTMDIVEFLHDVLKVKEVPGKFPHKVSVHNSCHGVRELGLSSPSERNVPPFNKIIDLLNLVEGIEIHEPERKDECCGFGGLFSVEEPDVSVRMGIDKVKRHMDTGAEYVTGPDSSCLMHMAGVAKRQEMPIKFIHVVEILAAGL
ncbi:MAG: (Fe-S)-binding protein [Prevotella sp.]|nr:(Fe-S)-binding protein [Prevotella sp.]